MRRLVTPGIVLLATTLGSPAPALAAIADQSRVPAAQPFATSTPETRLAISGDAYVRELRTPSRIRWRFGTAQVEQQLQLENGRLSLTRFTDRTHQHEYVHEPSDVLEFTWDGKRMTGRNTPWTLDAVKTQRLAQGELLLRIKLHTTGIAIIKHYQIYPKESIIQEWLQIVNRSGQPATLMEPASLTLRMFRGEVPAVDFTYMNGAPMNETRYHPTTLPLAGLAQTFQGTGNQEYSPIQVYQNRETHTGIFVGWDYMGTWRSTVRDSSGIAVVDFHVAPFSWPLAPNDTVETPRTFTGVFRGDLDDMGHQLLDYQYRYKWDYTREPYFPGVEMEGYWKAGSWYGGIMDPVATYRKVFHLADVMRTVGADIYWRDFGWWNRQGEWHGPDWGETRRYLSQYDMRQIIYIPVQDAQDGSKVALEHPDWLGGPSTGGGRVLDHSRPEVIAWELEQLESKQRAWGDFQWRKDFEVITPVAGTDRALLQDQNFRGLVKTFLDRNPGMAFHGCNSGAWDLGYEMLRFGVSWSMNDGGTDRWRAYFASYLYPPEKLENIPDRYDPKDYDKASWRGLLWNRFPTMGETEDPAQLDGYRELIDIYHYLVKAQVLGRWGFVYHPTVTGDGADWYLQRLSGDHQRGVIVPGHAPKTPVTIYPKGLLSNQRYHVSYQESAVTATRLGSDLMTNGIAFTGMPDGEIVYLNLPKHPGSAADRVPPRPPSSAIQQVATHMDYRGVELRWTPGRDDNWISYYEVYRTGVLLEKVAKGTYYFDHSLGADPAAKYSIVTVDGSGNRSTPKPVTGASGSPLLVVDDTDKSLQYDGTGWQHQTGQWAVANGTQAVTNTAGNAVAYTFDGSRVTWYGRMGPDKGVAAVYVDGQLDRFVDTYSADEMADIAVYSRTFPAVGRHTLKLVALGEKTGTRRAIRLNGEHGLEAEIQMAIGQSWREALASGEKDDDHLIVIDGFEVDSTSPQVVTDLPRWADSRVDYNFTGRSITWVGRRCAGCGIADVYVDGQLETSVDTYTPPTSADRSRDGDEQEHVPLFTRQWPKSGKHALRLVIRPDSNVWATGRAVHIDALHLTH